MKSKFFLVSLFAVSLMAFAGCAKQADTSKPIDQIKSEVESMSVGDLQSNAEAYVKAITAKKGELSGVADQIKKLSPTEIFSDKAKEIKSQLSQIESQVSALTERYQIYAEKFKEKGGDLSKVQLS